MVKNLKKLIEQVAKEKDIPEWSVEKALKNAIALAIRKDKNLKQPLEVHLENDSIKIYMLNKKGSGERVPMDISTEDINRIAAYVAKEEFLKELEKVEEERGYLELVEMEGHIVVGIARKVLENGDVVVDLGKVMALLPKREQIPKEEYKIGQRLRALLLEVKKIGRQYQATLSRTHPKFLRRLLELHIPEIKEGEIEIKAIAREPGEKAKVVVFASDMKMDPVGVVVGVKGMRIAPVSEELRGEKIDLIKWSDDTQELIKRSLVPAVVTKIRIIPEKRKAEVAVPKDKLSLAIGRHGVNVKLANKVSGWYIDILSEEDFEKVKHLG